MTKFSLKSVPLAPLPEDFAFFVGSCQYKCSQIAASVHCRTVRLLLLSDPTASFIVYPESDPKFQFRIFIQALSGNKIRIDESNAEFLWRVSTYFQCDDLKSLISRFLQSILTPEKCFAGIRERKVPSRCLAEVEYLARHFVDVMQLPEFGDLPLPILDSILSNTNLPDLQEEDDLFTFITAIVRRKKQDFPEYSSLFAHIVFEELSPEQLKQFLKEVSSADITGALWAALSVRLKNPTV